MTGYFPLPLGYEAEISRLEELILRFRSGQVSEGELKAFRVPFGVYEQRKRGLFMARIRCPAGCISLTQLRCAAEAATKFGSGLLHFTTRQEVQIHDLPLESIPALMRRLAAFGLATRGGGGNTVRNIMASCDSGLCAKEVFDVTPHAIGLTARLVADPQSWNLPRKFKIAFSNSEEDSAGAMFNDLGFVARLKNGNKGFSVYAAGGLGSRPRTGALLHEFLPEKAVLACATAVRNVFSAHGNRRNKHTARLRFLWESLGKERFTALYREEFDLLLSSLPPFEAAEFTQSGPEGHLAPPDEAVDEKNFFLWKKRYTQPQTKVFSATIPLEAGNMWASEALDLARRLAPLGEHCLRITMRQNLSVRGVPEKDLPRLYGAARGIAPLSDSPEIIGQGVVCSGALMCQLGICSPPGLLKEIRRVFAASCEDGDIRPQITLNISGCPNCCGRHLSADLGFYGKALRKEERSYPAYAIVAGARCGAGRATLGRSVGEIAARDVPDFVLAFMRECAPLVKDYPSFGDYLESRGEEDLRRLADRWKNAPSFEDDKNYYYDWGAKDQFSLAGRSQGECSAGLYDLIEIDRQEIEKCRGLLAGTTGKEEKAEALRRMLGAACRMLLITRGVEAKSPQEVFDLFRGHFFATGLIDRSFENVVAAGENDCSGLSLLPLEKKVLELADAVNSLYSGMDSAFRFQPQNKGKEPLSMERPLVEEQNTAVHATLDCRGVGCPMNFVKVKMRLSGLSSGQVLEVMLDDGDPVENVPKSAAAEGHGILRTERKDNAWLVAIRKG